MATKSDGQRDRNSMALEILSQSSGASAAVLVRRAVDSYLAAFKIVKFKIDEVVKTTTYELPKIKVATETTRYTHPKFIKAKIRGKA